MKLEEITGAIRIDEIVGETGKDILSIEMDSRLVVKGSLFVAVKGTQTDGHAFIGKAVAAGATAVVCEQLPETLVEGVTYVRTADTEDAVGRLATAFYGDPTSKLDLVGVTGTNGKTTIATLLYNMFRQFGYKVGLISTVCNYIDGEAIPTEHTTPDPITLNRLLGRMADEGCKYAFMEVSSHSIDQKRIGGLTYVGGIFTNITRDHIDYHKTFENYLRAKKTFFDMLPKTAFALTNADDKNGFVMVQNSKAKIASYSLRKMCDFKGKVLEDSLDGMLLDINGREVNVQFVGRFNASNLLAVYGAACLLGKRPEDVLLVLSMLRPVNGRFDTMRSPRGYTAIVDYAHTPDALVNVLSTIHEVIRGKGKVITVVGAGGNRDRGKRPIMAQESARLSDRLVITSDNPRFEEPQDIIYDMVAGLTQEDMRKTVTIADRRSAIRTACMVAQAGDVVLIAGKGHENYQEVRGVKHHFDDKEVVNDIFSAESRN